MRLLFRYICCLLLPLILLFSCKTGNEKDEHAETTQTPITTTTVSNGPLKEYIYLNATSTFLQRNYVKAIVGGYIQTVNAQMGKYVNKGDVLFKLKSKEANSIGSTINNLNPAFRFTGINVIRASESGFVTQINHQVGDYVQDGEQLAQISDMNSFAFVLSLPFELRRYIQIGEKVELILPDSTTIEGVVKTLLPTVDPASQTQNVIINVPLNNPIPENLIAKVRIVKYQKDNVESLPKTAILSNDVQSEFWVMKLIDSNTAVKIPITKGIETTDRVEVLSPVFLKSDKILITGNYGLPDTAKVKIVQ